MDKEFCTYEQALALKELGFDEECCTVYNGTNILIRLTSKPVAWCFIEEVELIKHNSSVGSLGVAAPTYSQALKWFREKHGLYHHIIPEFYTEGINFNWQILWYLPKEEWTKHVISDGTGLYGDNGEYPTQEEAEQACLDELIKIVKTKKDE